MSLTFKILFCFGSVLVAIVAIVAYFLLSRLGLGTPFPYQGGFHESIPILNSSVLNIVAKLPLPPGNIAVSKYYGIIFNFHPEFNSHLDEILGANKTKVAIMTDVDKFVPYPSLEFQAELVSVLSLRIDSLHRLWLLDFADHGIKHDPAIFCIELDTDEVILRYKFPKNVAGFGSMLNDFQVDLSGKYIYIADTSIIAQTPGLVLFDIDRQLSYRIASSSPMLFGDSYFLNVSGTPISLGPFGMKINFDSIALDRSGSNLYLGAVTSPNLYALSTSRLIYLIDRMADRIGENFEELEQSALQDIVHIFDAKPMSDGLSTDLNGNIWMTCVEHSAIAVLSVTSKLSLKSSKPSMNVYKVVQDKDLLRWPDGLSFGPDGLYITNSALQYKLSSPMHFDVKKFVEAHAPFHIVMIPSEALQLISGQRLPYPGH